MTAAREDFVVARNPEPGSGLPYLLRIPLVPQAVVLKSRESWPRTAKVYCHRVDAWPEDPDIVERVPVRSCVRRGAAIDLVLDRKRENRSQLVITQLRNGRQAIFWQTARTGRQARPAVALPSARAAGIRELELVVDSHERYAYRFADQQVRVVAASLPAGDYGVLRDGALVAAVERKSLADLVSSLVSGRLKYQLADLAALPRAAVVVEDRYSQVYALERVRPAVVADGLAEAQVRWPGVPIVFCETRKLAQEWTYRFLAAASIAADEEGAGDAVVERFAEAGPLPIAPPTPAMVRSWALQQGYDVSGRGRVPAWILTAYETAHEAPPAQAREPVAPVDLLHLADRDGRP